MIQTKLGNALLRLGEQERCKKYLEQARTAVESAYVVYSKAGYSQYDAYFEERIASLQKLIEKH